MKSKIVNSVALLSLFLAFSVQAQTNVNNFGDLQTAISAYASVATDMTVNITAGFDITAPLTIPTNTNSATLTIQSSGGPFALTRDVLGNLFTVNPGATLILEDVTIDGNKGVATYATNSGGSLVFVIGGSLELNTGAVLQNNAFSGGYGGGVYVNSGAVTMYGGSTISNNQTAAAGGVYVSGSGVFTMSGGTISGNQSTTSAAGGVLVSSSGTFTMSGGVISNNLSGNDGGGVFVGGGTFAMYGGTISGNQTSSTGLGGGVNVSSGAFTMYGGTISGNQTTLMGGGVNVFGGCAFTMSGGTISGNISNGYGGGVSVSGAFTMSGGTISNNNAVVDGVGVSVGSIGAFTMSGGVVFGTAANIANVVSGSYALNDSPAPAANDGMIIAWTGSAASYNIGTSLDIDTQTDISNPSTGIAEWDEVSLTPGISYANGFKAGFIPVPLVTINTASANPPVITSFPSTVTVNEGATVSITATLSTVAVPTPNFEWSYSSDGGMSFSSVLNDGIYSGAATATLTLTGVPLAYDDYQYRCFVSNSRGNDTKTLTLTVIPAPAYALTVAGGSGSGNYTAGTSVPITANTPPAGQIFSHWTTNNGGSFANANTPATTFTMPAANVTVTANYKTPPVAPAISGPAWMTLLVGYAAVSTDAFTVTGATPVTVTKTSGNDRITWNSSTHRLDIAAGLPAGTYPVEIRATNSVGYRTFTFTLTVENQRYYIDVPRSDGGTVTTQTVKTGNPFLSEAGDVVTITIAPGACYELSSIYVCHLDNPGILIPLSGSGATRTFVMPAHNITIVAIFTISTGIDTPLNPSLRAWTQNSVLYITGLTAGQPFSVYNILGTLIYRGAPATDKAEIPLPARGVYIVTVSSATIKVVN